MSLRWSLVVAVLAFISPACAKQTLPEEVRRITHWINELGDEDDSKRAEAKARLREALEESPAGSAAVLLRHANVVTEKQEIRLEYSQKGRLFGPARKQTK